jgi:hypothetical protein
MFKHFDMEALVFSLIGGTVILILVFAIISGGYRANTKINAVHEHCDKTDMVVVVRGKLQPVYDCSIKWLDNQRGE